MMIIKKFLDFLSKFHYNSIYKYSKNLNFEPNKKLFKRLHKKYKNNKKIKLYDCALGEKKSNKKLFLSNLTYNSTMSSFNANSNYLKFKNLFLKDQTNQKFLTIKQKEFDEVFVNKNIKNSFLKIDVEGYEYNVLKGAKKKLRMLNIF